jgi:uncharacterized protein YbjT (DUF2867 family)
MRVLVTGGTGTVGSQVVRELITRDAHVSVLTRDPTKARALPPGVRAVEGNLLDTKTVRSAFKDMDAVFLLNGVTQTESHEGLLALCGMQLANIKRLVYMSVQNADQAAWLPHFGSKVGIEEGIRRSGIPFTILRPNSFFQNDYWYKDAMLQAGIYPQPLGRVGTSRVDVRDIAEAAAVTLTSAGHEGETYDLVGPDAHTGESTAAVWSRALGRTIKYAGDDLDAWEKASLEYLPDWMVFDFKMMYDHFQRHGLKGSAEAIARQTKLLGHAPRSFDAFAQETAQAWGAHGAARV